MGAQMDLNFQLFETATLFITVIVVAFFLQVNLEANYETNLEYISLFKVVKCLCVWCFYAGRNIELLQRIDAHSLLFDSRR